MAAATVAAFSLQRWKSSPLKLCTVEPADQPVYRSVFMRLFLSVATLSTLAVLAACSTSKEPVSALSVGALPVMERVALGANRCWFKSKDPMFAAYKLAPELNSFSGTPRILIVKKHSPESRPLLVIQASGTPAKMSAFGPLMDDAAISARVHKDVNGWARNGAGC
jgi:hypothetical protein